MGAATSSVRNKVRDEILETMGRSESFAKSIQEEGGFERVTDCYLAYDVKAAVGAIYKRRYADPEVRTAIDEARTALDNLTNALLRDSRKRIEANK